MSAEERLTQLGIELPPAPKPIGLYKPIVVVGNVAYLSGHGPLKSDGTLIVGRVGDDMTLEQGQAAARQTARVTQQPKVLHAPAGPPQADMRPPWGQRAELASVGAIIVAPTGWPDRRERRRPWCWTATLSSDTRPSMPPAWLFAEPQ